MTNTPCKVVRAPFSLCTFGTQAANASATIALLGDSHAWQWRATVDDAAKALGWLAYDASRYGCAFSTGIPHFGEPNRASCLTWRRAITAWLREHPHIRTVIISNHLEAVIPAPGQSEPTAQVANILAAWRALPSTVKHIIVIRDTPYMRLNTLACVEEAIGRHHNAGSACAVPRSYAVRFDPDVAAARQFGSPRVRVVDLTPYFCSKKLCYPVVGGALVYRDPGHISSVYAATLGPTLTGALRADLPRSELSATAAAAAAGRPTVANAAHRAARGPRPHVCQPPAYPGQGYFTSLTVSATSCSTGRRLALAYYHCRLRHGKAGTCHSTVLGYHCHEKRNSIPTEIEARVTCHRGVGEIIHTYQQNL
jgi:hypothetical protein